MVAVPCWRARCCAWSIGVLVDRIGPEARRHHRPGHRHRRACWPPGCSASKLSRRTLRLGVVLGVAGASFAVALPLASRWYPPRVSGHRARHRRRRQFRHGVRRALRARARRAFGWNNVLGLAAIPLTVAFVVYLVARKDSPDRRRRRSSPSTSQSCASATPGGSCSSTPSRSAASSGLASSLTIYFNTSTASTPVKAGYFTAACVFVGSLVRPIGGALADRIGGIRALSDHVHRRGRRARRRQLPACQAWMALMSSSSACWRSAWATARCSSSCRSASGARSA